VVVTCVVMAIILKFNDPAYNLVLSLRWLRWELHMFIDVASSCVWRRQYSVGTPDSFIIVLLSLRLHHLHWAGGKYKESCGNCLRSTLYGGECDNFGESGMCFDRGTTFYCSSTRSGTIRQIIYLGGLGHLVCLFTRWR